MADAIIQKRSYWESASRFSTITWQSSFAHARVTRTPFLFDSPSLFPKNIKGGGDGYLYIKREGTKREKTKDFRIPLISQKKGVHQQQNKKGKKRSVLKFREGRGHLMTSPLFLSLI